MDAECQGLAPTPTQQLLGSPNTRQSPPLPTITRGGAPQPAVGAATPRAPGSNLFPGKRLLATAGQFAISPSSSASAPASNLVQTAQVSAACFQSSS